MRYRCSRRTSSMKLSSIKVYWRRADQLPPRLNRASFPKSEVRHFSHPGHLSYRRHVSYCNHPSCRNNFYCHSLWTGVRLRCGLQETDASHVGTIERRLATQSTGWAKNANWRPSSVRSCKTCMLQMCSDWEELLWISGTIFHHPCGGHLRQRTTQTTERSSG